VSRGTIHRTVRIDDALWTAAKAKADERGDSLSEIIREAIRAYVERED
jgi:predicted transcriptional regulator